MTEDPCKAKGPLPWRQIAMVFLCSFALAFVCCAGGATLLGGKSTAFGWAGGLLILVGLGALFTFIGTILYALWRLLAAVVSGARR
jgi:hypothetical protein